MGVMSTEQPERLQVVGIDGSPCSQLALSWALARAPRLGPVRPVSAWHYPWWALVPTATGSMVPPGESEFEAIAHRVVGQALDGIDDEHLVAHEVIHGAPGPALVSATERASLLVVGTRGRGAVAGSVLGSVSLHCVNRAPVPVAVIPDGTPVEDRHQRVVVGADGSANGRRALAWALDHTPASTQIDVVHAWDPGAAMLPEVAVVVAEKGEQQSQELVASTIEAIQDRIEVTGHTVNGISHRGDPRRTLRSEAETADLLVVGARGHEGVAHLLLGSVATALVHHPNAATVVVR